VLAAGRGVRFDPTAPKQLTPLAGEPLVAHAVRAAIRSGLAPVIVVVSDERVAVALPDGVQVARNPAPEAGIASSLHAALDALAGERDVDGAVIGLADQPLVGPDAYRRLARAYDEGARLAVATYGGGRANPVLLAREHWDEARTLQGDEGARVLFRTHGAVEVPCDGTGDPADVDTPADLAAIESRLREKAREKAWRSQTASE